LTPWEEGEGFSDVVKKISTRSGTVDLSGKGFPSRETREDYENFSDDRDVFGGAIIVIFLELPA